MVCLVSRRVGQDTWMVHSNSKVVLPLFSSPLDFDEREMGKRGDWGPGNVDGGQCSFSKTLRDWEGRRRVKAMVIVVA